MMKFHSKTKDMKARYNRLYSDFLRLNQYLKTSEEVEQAKKAIAGALRWAEKQDRLLAIHREKMRTKGRVME